MIKLPTDLSGQDLIKALRKVGFVVQKQRGSHIVLRCDTPFARVTVPNHKASAWERFERFCMKLTLLWSS
jgi:predicted RNA binding protein YcfA (HicA-like mRNA interferase family)